MSDFLISDRAIALLQKAHNSTKDYIASLERAAGGAVPGETDPLGQPIEGAYTFLADVPCAYVPARGATERRTAEANYYSKNPELHVAPGTDVKLNDRVTKILDRHGLEIETGAEAFNIIEIRPGRVYLALVLEKFGG